MVNYLKLISRYSKLFSAEGGLSIPREILMPGMVLIKDLVSGIKSINEKFPWMLERSIIITGPEVYKAINIKLNKAFKKYPIEVVKRKFKVPDRDLVEEVCENIRKSNGGHSSIFGIGGGSKIDLAKLVASELKAPFISVPTAASHDGIASHFASISVDGERNTVPTVMPQVVLVDTDIIKSAKRLNVSGFGDIVANYTASEDWRLSSEVYKKDVTKFSRNVCFLSNLTGKAIMDLAEINNGNLEEMLDMLIMFQIASGSLMASAESSAPCSGSEHAISHVLDREYLGRDAKHGEQCGVAAILSAYLQRQDWKLVKRSLELIGGKTTAEDLGLSGEQFYEACLLARDYRGKYTILNEKKDEKIRKAIEKTGIA